MTTNPTDLAAALNECMPLNDGVTTWNTASPGGSGTVCLSIEGTRTRWTRNQDEIIGILWAECVRRGWHLELTCSTVKVSTTRNGRFDLHFQKPGTDALAFARASAAAKKAGEA